MALPMLAGGVNSTLRTSPVREHWEHVICVTGSVRWSSISSLVTIVTVALSSDEGNDHPERRLHAAGTAGGEAEHERALKPPTVGNAGPEEVLLAESLRKLDLDLARLRLTGAAIAREVERPFGSRDGKIGGARRGLGNLALAVSPHMVGA
jgi:hypothetical protein